MSDRSWDVYAEGPEDALLDTEESVDSDNLGELEDGKDPLDDTWDPPDGPSRAGRFGTTATEQRDGESLDDLLAEEEPDVDPYLEAERLESGETLESDVADVRTVGPGDLLDDTGADPDPSQLVADDEGAHDDETPELIAHDGGGSGGGGGGPEDGALHIDRDA